MDSRRWTIFEREILLDGNDTPIRTLNVDGPCPDRMERVEVAPVSVIAAKDTRIKELEHLLIASITHWKSIGDECSMPDKEMWRLFELALSKRHPLNERFCNYCAGLGSHLDRCQKPTHSRQIDEGEK